MDGGEDNGRSEHFQRRRTLKAQREATASTSTSTATTTMGHCPSLSLYLYLTLSLSHSLYLTLSLSLYLTLSLSHSRCVEFSGDQNVIVSGGWDGHVKVWDPRSAQCTGLSLSLSGLRFCGGWQKWKCLDIFFLAPIFQQCCAQASLPLSLVRFAVLPARRAGHFRYFYIFSLIKNDFFHFYQVKLI